MKILKTATIFALLFSAISSWAIDAQQILMQAMADSREMSFRAAMTNPFLGNSIQKIILPRTSHWVFYRQYDDGELCLRLEMYEDNNDLQMVYLHNSTGNYGTFDNYNGGKIIMVPYLWFAEQLTAEIMPEELKMTNFVLSEIIYKGIPCYEVVTTLEGGEATIETLAQDPSAAFFANKRELYLANRAYSRKFIIDKKSNQILSRRHYSSRGDEIFVCEFDAIDYDADINDSLFETPKSLHGEFNSWQSLASLKLAQLWESPQSTQATRIDFNMIYMIIYVIVGFILLLLVVIGVMQLRKRRA